MPDDSTKSPDSWHAGAPNSRPLAAQRRQMEGQEWWLWVFVVVVTLLLTLALVSFTFPLTRTQGDDTYWFNVRQAVLGLAGLVLLFDIYTLYQQLQIHRMRRQLNERNELFRLIGDNAADMIAVVDVHGRRLYNSPAYKTVLGYSAEELGATSAFEQIHPEDQPRVAKATEEARRSGVGQRLEYRIRHKNGSWRILESVASAVPNARGEVDKLVIVNRDITERKSIEERLAHNAFHDSLTELPNRPLFLDRLQRAFNYCKRHPGYKFAVLFIDLDGFKDVNDTFGHSVGDELLVQVGQRLTASLRHDDTVSRPVAQAVPGALVRDDVLARFGGDEFTVLIEDIKDPSDAIRVAERIQSRLAIAVMLNGQRIFTSASIGIALSTTPHSRAEDLLRDADLAMYRAKSQGKSRWQIFDTAMHANAVQRWKLETDLRRGMERGELENYYQPVIALQHNRICGFEALARWQHPERGLLSPCEFMAAAEETGLIVPINRYLLREACKQMRLWHSQFPSDPPLLLSMNVAARQFAQDDIVNGIHAALLETGLAPGDLQLEIVETVAMADAERASGILGELKQLGVRLSIDDFGTGYSSLSRLRRFPFDTLKIDRSFISSMQSDRDNREIVETIVMLARNLGLKVVAEGTETAEQIKLLQGLRCEFAQGYFFSPPVAAGSVPRLFEMSWNQRAEAAPVR